MLSSTEFKRAARSYTCSSLSSPDTYNTVPYLHIALLTWARSDDLPVPGGAPNKHVMPLMKPPPITRSNSSIPVGMRSGRLDDTDDSWRAGFGGFTAPVFTPTLTPSLAGDRIFLIAASRSLRSPSTTSPPQTGHSTTNPYAGI